MKNKPVSGAPTQCSLLAEYAACYTKQTGKHGGHGQLSCPNVSTGFSAGSANPLAAAEPAAPTSVSPTSSWLQLRT